MKKIYKFYRETFLDENKRKKKKKEVFSDAGQNQYILYALIVSIMTIDNKKTKKNGVQQIVINDKEKKLK